MAGKTLRYPATAIALAPFALLAAPALAQPVSPDQPAGLPITTQQPATQPPEQPQPAVRLGDMRSLLRQVPTPPPTGPAREWNIVPSLAVQELATDNVFNTPNGRRADLITTISPGILINGDTQRLHLVLTYSPQLQLYAFTPGQTNIAQDLNGAALVELMPNWLYVRAQAYAVQQALSGGFAPAGAPVLTNQNRVDTNSFTLSPYLSHTFDGTGTVQLGYAFNHTSQSGETAFLPGSSLPFFTSTDISSNEEFAKFSTGENFGRINDKLLLDATQNTGFGIVQNSHQNFFIDLFSYALDRKLALLAEGGYEQIAYPNGSPPVRIDDAVWGAGFKLQPNPDSTIVALYRHLYGVNAPYLDAKYALTARTKIYASYSDILGTPTQILQDALSEITLNQSGTPISAQTGAPVLLTNQMFGVQTGLLRQKQLSVTLTTTFPRDIVSLNALHLSQTLVSISPGTTGYSQSGTSGSISWTHVLTPVAAATAYLQYGRVSQSVFGTAEGSAGPVFSASLSLAYKFSQSLTGTVQYIVTHSTLGPSSSEAQPSGLPSQSTLQNTVIVGVLKQF